MRGLNNDDQNLVIVDVRENPVVAHALAPEILVHEPFTEQTRIIKARTFVFDETTDTRCCCGVTFPYLLDGLWRESDRVPHSGRTTSVSSIASSTESNFAPYQDGMMLVCLCK